jgi:glucose-1-phosphate cytidylyltransferase
MAHETGIVSEFNEKPQATGGRISGGFFVCNTEIFDYIAEGDETVFEQNPMRNLVTDEQLMMFEHDGFWQPMDTHREFVLLNGLYEKGTAPWVIW